MATWIKRNPAGEVIAIREGWVPEDETDWIAVADEDRATLDAEVAAQAPKLGRI